VIARIDRRYEREFAFGPGSEAHRDRLLGVGGIECDGSFVDQLIVEFQMDDCGLPGQALATDANEDLNTVVDEADVAGEKAHHRNVARRGDADTIDIQRDTGGPGKLRRGDRGAT